MQRQVQEGDLPDMLGVRFQKGCRVWFTAGSIGRPACVQNVRFQKMSWYPSRSEQTVSRNSFDTLSGLVDL